MRVLRCPECGCEELPPSASRLRIEKAEVPAIQCSDCGRQYPQPGMLEKLDESRKRQTWRPRG